MQDSAPDILDHKTFLGHLREALGHLYEPHYLRRSPLAALFGVANRSDTPSALQRILVEAIEALKPVPSEPAHSPAWELYIPLSYRFVEQLGQEEVAHQMAISTRHLRRRERAALQALGDLLWDQFNLGSHMTPLRTGDEAADEPDGQLVSTPQAVAEELGWLADRSEQHRTNLCDTLPSIVELACRLASGHGVQFETDIAEGLPDLACDPVALRQVLINLITVV
ncbi:MAG: hypothetical protein GX601_02705, partial [Anaerolineales bacterium]|nr:hypothetical protein [Anaerolineales bacterium]